MITANSVDMQRVFSHIDASALARDVLGFVEVNSETGKDGEGSSFLARLLRREGFPVTLDDIGRRYSNVYSLIRGTGEQNQKGSTLLFNGHVDTIPIGRCVSPKLEGAWITGRGAEDMKGGLVAIVHAASALRKAGVRLKGDLWLTGVVDHESPEGKKAGPRRLIQRLQEGEVQADAIIISEGPSAIWRASLGNTIFTFTIVSDLGSIHTIKVPYKENPALWLGRLLIEMQKMEEEFSSVTPHPICGRENLNVGMITGGDYFNRLPTPVTVTGKWRWKPGKTFGDLRKQLQELCDRLSTESGLHFSVSFTATREPHETPESHQVVESLKAAGLMVAEKKPEVIGMALAGDANYYANEAGVPTVYYGPAYETAHSDNERVSVSQLVHCAKMYAATAIAFCGVAQWSADKYA
jgi:acetylornithine deacetylase/succinyl-diaminopimelate desuccinylase-like protein